MTSQINYSAIDTTYPIAGRDNDSQGFRDNFSAISSALAVAKNEITDIQTRAVVVADVDNTTADNNLQGSVIRNGVAYDLHGKAINRGNLNDSSEIDNKKINIALANLYAVTLTGPLTMTFVNWPDSDNYAVVRLHVRGDGVSPRTLSLATENGGSIVYATGFPSLALSTTKYQVLEAWTYTGSTDKVVYVRHLGEF
jgi:hypothetical protein